MRSTITMTIWRGKETWRLGITRQGVSREESERGAQCPPSLGAWDGGGEAGVRVSGTIRVMSFRQAIDVTSKPCLLNPSWTIFSITSQILLVGNGPITWMRGLPSITDNLNLTTSQLSDGSCAASGRGEIETTNAVRIRAATQGVSPFRIECTLLGGNVGARPFPRAEPQDLSPALTNHGPCPICQVCSWLTCGGLQVL